jgi:hypothetical protein
MAKKHTLIKTTYCDGVYSTTIGTDVGGFTGMVFCRPEDREHQTDYFGWELAEIKAEIQCARAKKKHFDAKLKALSEFWREMSSTRTYDIDAFWVKKIRIKIDDAYYSRQYWSDRIEVLKKIYHEKIMAMDEWARKRKEKNI